MPCYSPLKGWKNDEGGLTFKKSEGKSQMEVACGQCLGCRLDRSRVWAMRISHEASLYQHSNGNSFITLTYDNEHVPQDGSLDKTHFQKFMKRLRKSTAQKIKFYHCGEYGNQCKHGIDLTRTLCPLCNLGRPHYHACLFNKEFSDLTPYETQGDITRTTSPELEQIWGKGVVDVGKLEFQSAAYVARYIMKKITGEPAKDHYQNINPYGEIIKVEPEYSTMSNGIGRDWYEKYKDDCFPSDETPVPGQGVIPKVPRYYADLLKESDPQMHDRVKAIRQTYRNENMEEYTPERLMAKYKVKKAQTTNLTRD